MSRKTPVVGPDDRRRVQPPTDAQRLLGQIERGEVRAGAEAARQIAARHQAAYGNAVWGPTTTRKSTPVSDRHTEPHPLAGQTVTLPDGSQFHVEDWNDRVFGESWMFLQGHPASLAYAVRSATAGLPLNNEVVYGKTSDGLGQLVHVEELPGGGAR